MSRNITIINKPPITLAFRDTLICLNDQLQLSAIGAGNFSWTPSINMLNPNSGTPTVSPAVTTTYYTELNSDGCLNQDSVKVRVVDHVSLQLMPDTVICTLDTIRLRVTSDGLHYAWTPANQFVDPSVSNPIVITPGTTNYQVNAVIGGCNTTGSILVRTVNYPVVHAGSDSTICYNTSAQLTAVTDGTSWVWTPTVTIRNPNTLTPLANPKNTTQYVLTVYNLTSGCPKPVTDTVVITVLPVIHAFAGRDTAVIIGQPLQMSGSGGDRYLWSPATALSSTVDPVTLAVYSEPSTGIQYKLLVYNAAGCVDSAFVNVKVFATIPTVFVPSAFTPNNDGLNDVLRPIAVGMQSIEYFNVYNRWGQLVFSTRTNGHGWDGRINGQPQANNTFVWMVKAIDFNGGPYFSKGMVTLIK